MAKLFVIQDSGDGAWIFRNAGETLSQLLGRELADHDFLNFWTGHDKMMLSCLLEAVCEERSPGLIRGRGETLTGQRVELEITLAPVGLARAGDNGRRLLGLYQTLGGAALLNGRPLWRHRLTALFPPESRTEPPRMQIVASND